jgi:hypothetical protein
MKTRSETISFRADPDLLKRMSVPARKWAIIPEPGEPLRNVSIPVDGHVRRTQMADRLQRNDGFFEAYSDVQWRVWLLPAHPGRSCVSSA